LPTLKICNKPKYICFSTSIFRFIVDICVLTLPFILTTQVTKETTYVQLW